MKLWFLTGLLAVAFLGSCVALYCITLELKETRSAFVSLRGYVAEMPRRCR